MSNNTADSIKCPVCLTRFDADKHLPKISPTCGHTVCKDCLIQVLKMNTPKCPLDNLRFGSRNIDDFPTNLLGKDLLETGDQPNLCEVHREQKKVVCLTDNTLICSNCAIFGDHKGHQVKQLSSFGGEEILSKKKNRLLTIAGKMSELTNDLEEKKKLLKGAIKSKFQNLYSEIQKQEISVLLEVEDIFMSEKIRLSNMMSPLLDLSFDIQARLKELDNGMSSPNIVKLLEEEDFSDLERIIAEKLAPFKTKHIEEISELLAVYENNVLKANLLRDFSEALNEGLALFHEKRDSLNIAEQTVIETKAITLPSAKLELFEVLEKDLGVMKVQGSEAPKRWTVPKAEFEAIQKIIYSFKLDENLIDENVLSAIKLVSKYLKNIKTVHVQIDAHTSYQGLCEGQFFHLVSAIFSNLHEDLEEIRIFVMNAPIRDLGLRHLAEIVLPRFKNLKVFDFRLGKTQTTSEVLRALSKINFSTTHPNLENLKIGFNRCHLNDEDLIDFLNTIPQKTKYLLLHFVEMPLTDRAFHLFSRSVLPSLDKIETLGVVLWGTNITDEGVQKLLKNIPNVNDLYLDFSATKITDEGIREFVNCGLETWENGKKLTFNLKDTKISKNLLEKVQKLERKEIPSK